MNNEEILKIFNQLDINNKRNKISDELMIIGELINSLEKNNNILPNLKVKNYDQNKDINISEEEALTFFYEDIFNIEKELIVLVSLLNAEK